MKGSVFFIAVALILALCVVPQAEASSLLRIDVSGTTLSCNNSDAAGVTACGAAGFVTSLNSSVVTFTGTINGVNFGAGPLVGVQLFGNQPGTPDIAFVLDTKTAINNVSGGIRTVTVDFAGNNFTNPVGIGFLNASQTANWTTSTGGDSQAFSAWQRNDNALTVPGPGASGATAISPNCVSPGGLSQSCASETLNIPATPAAPFALTGRQVLTMANGTLGSFTGTATLVASTPVIPEPSTVVLLGSGMLLLAGQRFRSRRK